MLYNTVQYEHKHKEAKLFLKKNEAMQTHQNNQINS